MKMLSLKQRDLKLGKVAHAAVPATQDPKAGRALEPQERGVIIHAGRGNKRVGSSRPASNNLLVK